MLSGYCKSSFLVCFFAFQIEIETLIRECRNPPRPDAVCRYPDCASKSHIYLSDPGMGSFQILRVQ